MNFMKDDIVLRLGGQEAQERSQVAAAEGEGSETEGTIRFDRSSSVRSSFACIIFAHYFYCWTINAQKAEEEEEARYRAEQEAKKIEHRKVRSFESMRWAFVLSSLNIHRRLMSASASSLSSSSPHPYHQSTFLPVCLFTRTSKAEEEARRREQELEAQRDREVFRCRLR
jgi:hypothetical protein